MGEAGSHFQGQLSQFKVPLGDPDQEPWVLPMCRGGRSDTSCPLSLGREGLPFGSRVLFPGASFPGPSALTEIK